MTATASTAVTPTTPAIVASAGLATITNPLGANLRSVPDRNANPVVTVKNGERFPVLGLDCGRRLAAVGAARRHDRLGAGDYGQPGHGRKQLAHHPVGPAMSVSVPVRGALWAVVLVVVGAVALALQPGCPGALCAVAPGCLDPALCGWCSGVFC